jgi:hypothetical protein
MEWKQRNKTQQSLCWAARFELGQNICAGEGPTFPFVRSCFLSIFLDTLFCIPSPSTLHVTLRTIMDSIQFICLFSPSNVHLHMLALEKVGLVTWP